MRHLVWLEFSASKDLPRKPRSVINCVMSAANLARKSCEHVLSCCEPTLLKFFMIIPISVHSRCLRRRNVRDHRMSCAESLDGLYNHIRIGACVHLRSATGALIGK